jgi:hypothetical protein
MPQVAAGADAKPAPTTRVTIRGNDEDALREALACVTDLVNRGHSDLLCVGNAALRALVNHRHRRRRHHSPPPPPPAAAAAAATTTVTTATPTAAATTTTMPCSANARRPRLKTSASGAHARYRGTDAKQSIFRLPNDQHHLLVGKGALFLCSYFFVLVQSRASLVFSVLPLPVACFSFFCSIF